MSNLLTPEELAEIQDRFHIYEVRQLLDHIETIQNENRKMVVALDKIAKWFGEFPETGRTWEGSGEPMSYGAVNGSNGERDFMRQIAREAMPQ